MAKKKIKNVHSNTQFETAKSIFGFSLKGWVASSVKAASARETRAGVRATVIVVSEPQPKRALLSLKKQLGAFPKWQEAQLTQWLESQSPSADLFSLTLKDGPVWFVRLVETSNSSSSDGPRETLEKSVFARARDAAGAVLLGLRAARVEKLVLDFTASTREELQGFLTGLEIANYSFTESRGYKAVAKRPTVLLLAPAVVGDAKDLKTLIQDSSRLGVAVNLARHLTNLPGGTLTPTAYADLARAVMADATSSKDVRIDVWDERRLKAENMNLLLAVGSAAASPPRLVHISYRPKDRGAEKRPIALVGKGVTFDSGGLDIKPSSGMRLMKKDMGGSAAVLALTWLAVSSGLPLALDSYLALAENAISSNSFRPGDIIKARNGLAIEIHNTDAEGRLVLADAMNVAVGATGEDAPACLIDLATLTGAIKVGLGGDIAGLFTNNDDLAREIFDAGLKRGDLSWRMPLFQPYKSMLRSNFADHVNAGDGFGGAITAALFLELFAKSENGAPLPWAHLDIYAWKDSPSGAWTEPGGSGQGVLSLSEVLGRFVSGKWAEG